ncbi:uncharacterized protein LOC131166353 isoform X2 [Malania oleifera]|uniref:uncharacterized protein LOC131166353 isoform X2 n=1 Tax=Malania oleifera TaxID=397392 RepID=UPI0025ADB893|nr:uncharacterized protein LOC131166353 isoform X2 [Malania oleifera]XP_057980807.1 uncharacterized protein LOC131166353 isoform X2 [Malania oleifera]
MSVVCGLPILECVYCLACARWVWKKCLYTAGHESENWGLATAEEFEPVPRLCRLILSVYEDDLQNPLWAPPEGYGINLDWVILRKNYDEIQGQAPPYMIYLDHDNADIVLAIRGLNLAKESDYAVLLDDKLGQTTFDGGYVHNGLLKAAEWVLDAECKVLRELVERNPNYTLTFAGHSLGSGVVTLLAMAAIQNRDKLGNIERKRVRCYAMAPARCVSLNLAVRYADIINSVVLQDDFLPRTTAALENVFKSLFWIGRFPPVVRTAVPVDGRFDHVVLSCNVTSDHAIIWIERESQRALDLMLERDRIMEIPAKQRMERQKSLARDHNEEYIAALQRAVALAVPLAYSPSRYGTFHEMEVGEHSHRLSQEVSFLSSKNNRESWDELVERLFDTDESGHMVLKKL